MISAIIPFRDWSVDRLQGCVDLLQALPSITEILVIDFGSQDPLGNVPGARVVRVEADRWCLSEANNIGIAEASNKVILKIDADVQLLLDDATMSDLAETVLNGEVSFFVLQPTDFQYNDNGDRVLKRLRPEWGEGCGNLFSRADVVEIGGFDSRYFDYGGEDNDLCQRLRRYGKRVEYFGSDKVLHERHPPSAARLRGLFSDTQKRALLAEHSIFRPEPFRYSDYKDNDVFGPAITVAIATTDRPNRAAHLDHCLAGLANQTFQGFEVRICENGSPKGARLKLKALQKAFPTLDLHLHRLDEPSIPKARNLITDHARGFYIAVHDDDDFSMPTRFEEQLECMATHKGAHGCHSAWIEFDEEDGGLRSFNGQIRDIGKLMRRPGKVTLHSTAFYRKDVLQKIRYNEDLTLGSDYELHVRMLLIGLLVPHTERFHCYRRLHKSSVTNGGTVVQRDVADRVNGAYKYFLGAPFLAKVRAQKDEQIWVTGYPTSREMLTYLPDDFGSFRLDLALEAALSLGFDPVFGGPTARQKFRAGGITFEPAWQGHGHQTRLVLRSVQALCADDLRGKLPAFARLPGVDIVSDAALASNPKLRSIEELRVNKGERRVISRIYPTMADALSALPEAIFEEDWGRIEFFAVNHPNAGVHVMLGTYDNLSDLENALNAANNGVTGNFVPVANKGKPGSFYAS